MNFLKNTKLFLFLFLAFFVSTVYANPAYSQSEFAIHYDVTYEINKDLGLIQVNNKVSLTNNFSNLYATSYTLVLENINPSNVGAREGAKQLKSDVKKDGDMVSIRVDFDDSVVGKGKTREFEVYFEVADLVSRNGKVWEVNLPKTQADAAVQTQSTLIAPVDLGKPAYISPEPDRKFTQDNKQVFIFSKEKIAKTGVSAAFGEFQIFSFRLSYHLENPLSKDSSTQIALPPDTSYQKVFYFDINPKPENVSVDPDGNWMATYLLSPRERIDVVAQGKVQIFASPWKLSDNNPSDLGFYVSPTSVWQSDDPKIIQIAQELKKPQAIYNFVTETLSYDYNRVRPNIERKGALSALSTPTNSICMEFTDLFIALARAAGIAAREINGFAYTDNPKIQPLSLVADVLHSWPEYWDETREIWVPVDPTWGSTTGGVDYFNKLDLNHFSFVVHGFDPQKPYPAGSYKLGDNPQKDVNIAFDTLPEVRKSSPQAQISFGARLTPFSEVKIITKITNPGPVALYDLPFEILLGEEKIGNDNITILPPFSSLNVQTNYMPEAISLPPQVTLILGDVVIKKDVPTVELLAKPLVILSAVLLALTSLTLVYFIKRKRPFIPDESLKK